ncbi:hypothetical protein [Novipirellula artificiosorum]|uniref:Uncharacterized protein n=1 Tax=Novipirellula artificiosorum TaxID=2528016 RepID=A0A5C6DDM0_9BACT|nr:hypothetical protein [Novipirellula artificiosorum]TWU33791.1 hypothetical protein Poly41_47890 [Novipirellula artificiosorum]
MRCFLAAAGCAMASACLTFLSGCDQESRPDEGAVDSRYVLASEPADAKTPTELKDTLVDAADVVVAGRIDAGDLEPFEEGKATFVLTQLADEEHAQGDPDHANKCPFCKRELLNAPKVVVEFRDDDGIVIAQDARQMLGIRKGDAVVVVGTADYQEPINMIQVNATGVFRRSPEN